MLAADSVHDLKGPLPRAAAGGAGHERDEVLGLLGAGTDVERLQCEAGVSDPCKPVVPVALAADGLRERGGRRRHDRTGGPVAKALQDPGAQPHQIPVRPLVDVVCRLPRAPCLDRVRDPLGDAIGVRWRERVGVLRRHPAHREAQGLPVADLERRAHSRVRHLDLHSGADGNAIGPPKVRPPFSSAEQRLHQPVLRSRCQLHLELDPSRDSLHRAQDLVGDVEAEIVSALPVGECHRVAQAHGAGRGAERRLHHQRAGDVTALGLERAGGPDRPVPGPWIQNPRKDRRAVVAGHAQPVDRALPADQCGRVAVGEQPVVGDRQILRALPLPAHARAVLDELLAAVDVKRGAGQRGVRHDVHGQRSDVLGADDAPDRELLAKLLTARFELIAQQRCGQRRIATKPAAIRFTRTGASSSARLAMRAGDASVWVDASARPKTEAAGAVPPMNSRVPPGRTMSPAARAT